MITPTQLPLGYYHPGQSLIHRTPCGIKLCFTIIFCTVTPFYVKTIPHSAYVLVCVFFLYFLSHIPVTIVAQQLLPTLPFLLFITCLAATQQGWSALSTLVIIFSSLAVTTLVTLTTSVSELLNFFSTLMAPLAHIGIPAEKISITLSITIRFIPLAIITMHEVYEAVKTRPEARGSPKALVIPIIVRTLLRAKALSEALHARGIS